MMPETDRLFRRAERAYESVRLRKAVLTSALVLPMTALSLACACPRGACVGIAAVLGALVGGCVWRGGARGRAVTPGLVAGLVPLMIPFAARTACSCGGSATGLLVCVGGGVLSGVILALFARRVRQDRAAFLVWAGAVAALAGSLGCIVVGLGGVAAMVVGLVLTAPFALRPAPAGT